MAVILYSQSEVKIILLGILQNVEFVLIPYSVIYYFKTYFISINT